MTPNVCCGQNLLNNLGLKLWDLLSHLVSFCLMFKFSLYSFPPLSENSRSFVTLMNCLILNLSKPTELAPTRKPVRICDLLKNVSLSLRVCVSVLSTLDGRCLLRLLKSCSVFLWPFTFCSDVWPSSTSSLASSKTDPRSTLSKILSTSSCHLLYGV